MDKNYIYSVIVGFLLGVAAMHLCTGQDFSGTDGGKEFRSASDNAKQQYAEHHKVASELNSRVANYNRQLEVGCGKSDEHLRNASKHIELAVKYYEEKIKREQSESNRN